MPAATTDQYICKQCRHPFSGSYCNNCGEKRYTDKDKSLWHLLEEAFHFITHFEGSFLNTLRAIFTSPGKLSSDYCEGVRKKYFRPISFFLVLVVLYLLFPVFEGLNMRLYYHTHHSFYGNFAMARARAVMIQKHLTDAQITEAFHHKGETVSKFLLLINIPAMAAISWLLGFKKRRYYFDHFIFSTELLSVFILWGFLLLPMILVVLTRLKIYTTDSEGITLLAIMSVFFIYTVIAARRFFHFSWWYDLVYSLAFAAGLIVFTEYIYKFILFAITINLI
jgi:hypothetical protein